MDHLQDTRIRIQNRVEQPVEPNRGRVAPNWKMLQNAADIALRFSIVNITINRGFDHLLDANCLNQRNDIFAYPTAVIAFLYFALGTYITIETLRR